MDELEEQHHRGNREVALSGLDEDDHVDEEEHDVEGASSGDVHLVPERGLGSGDRDCLVVVVVEVLQLGAFRGERLHGSQLAHDFSEAAAGDVVVLVLLRLPDLPLPAGQHRQIDERRVDDREQDREQWRVPAGNEQRRDDGHQGREESVGEDFQEVRDRGDRTIETRDDGTGEFGVEVALREAEQLLVVVVREDRADLRAHHVAEVAADVVDDRVREHEREQQRSKNQEWAQLGLALSTDHLDDGLCGLRNDERCQECRRGGDDCRDDDAEIERPQAPGAGNDPDNISHASTLLGSPRIATGPDSAFGTVAPDETGGPWRGM